MKNYFPKILISGARGQIGQTLLHHARASAFPIAGCTREQLDITNISSIHRVISETSPDFIINTAAYTAVDNAEKNQETAMHINHLGAKNLAIACQQHRIPLIHLSTDYIFDGKKTLAYAEEDIANPLNVYGKSKWMGELAVQQYCEQHIILRTSAVFSEYGQNFFRTLSRLAKEQHELNIVTDQITCPTYAGNIADVIFTIIQSPAQWGTYHYCDTHAVSWYQFAEVIIRAMQDKKIHRINAVTSKEYAAPAKRPDYSVLSCAKIEKTFGTKQGNWISAIRNLL